MESNIINKLYVKKIVPEAYVPTKGSQYAAGYDLMSVSDYVIPPMEKMLISTGISVAIPISCYGRIAPRSGLAVKNFIDVGAGVIDSDYRGEIKILLFNFGKQDFVVNVGDRVAQLIIEKYSITQIEQCDYLDDTIRGNQGFGSTGI